MEEEQSNPTLEDGHEWAEYVIEKWQREEWLRDDLTNLIHTLPQVYDALELFGYHRLARKLHKAVQGF